jgi:hypothetical protein
VNWLLGRRGLEAVPFYAFSGHRNKNKLSHYTSNLAVAISLSFAYALRGRLRVQLIFTQCTHTLQYQSCLALKCGPEPAITRRKVCRVTCSNCRFNLRLPEGRFA